jgi:AcrR family transcriptional regulator
MALQTSKTQRMSAEERREQLLDAAKRVVERHGFHGVSIEAVAREAGITRPIVYGHFHDLGGLLEALIERESERALAQLAKVLPRDLSGDPADTLLAALRGYLGAVRQDPGTWRLVLMPQEGAPQALHEHINAGRSAVVAQLAAAMAPGLGSEPPPDPELAARMLSAFADEAARLLLTDPERYSVDRILAQAQWGLGRLPAG